MKANNLSLVQDNKMLMENNLHPVNSVLKQFFETSIIPQLLIDSNLILKDFTPPAEKLFSLNNDDIEKSIYTIKDKFDHKAFIESLKGVFMTERVLQKEVKTADNSRYLMNIQPVFSDDDDILCGLLITYYQLGIPFSLIKELEDLKTENHELKELLLQELRKSR